MTTPSPSSPVNGADAAGPATRGGRLTPARRAAMTAYLAAARERFDADAGLLREGSSASGYHTTLPPGTPVHATRSNAEFAVALLAVGDAADRALAAAVLEKVVAAQDVRDGSKTAGIWSWYFEEPLDRMDPPDHNWADFIGARLAHAVVEYPDRLPPETLARVEGALARAAAAIVRRDVTPTYTNIAIMGPAVTAAAGEALGDPALVDFARRKLAAVEASVADLGSFAEYNSPTYTIVAIEELDRTLQLVRDPAVRASARRLLDVAWASVAEHWHPGTGQWAGPHARAYADRLRPDQAAFLARGTGLPIGDPAAPMMADGRGGTAGSGVVSTLPCPARFIDRFRALPSPETIVHRLTRRGERGMGDQYGTTWLAARASLGTFNRAHYWIQSRPVLGYLATPDGAAVFRARFVFNGRDFASGYGVHAQDRHRALSAAHLVTGTGHYHPYFGRSETNTFDMTDLRLRLELAGAGASVEPAGPGRWALRVPGHRVVVHAPAATFEGRAIEWAPAAPEAAGDVAALEAVCYAGPSRPLAVAESELRLMFAVELLDADAPAAASSPEVSADAGETRATWDVGGGKRLEVAAPLRAVPFAW